MGYMAVPSWTVSASAMSKATAHQIWAWYTDTAEVPRWDPLVKEVISHGPFQVNTQGENIPYSGPAMRWTLTEVSVDRSYTESSRLPLATLEATHTISSQDHITKIEHGITVHGPAAWVYRILFGRKVEVGMRRAIDLLAAHASDGSPDATVGR